MSAKLIYAHLCDQVLSTEGGKLTLVGIFAGHGVPGSIGMNAFPATYPRLALAAGISTTQKELPIEVTFRAEDGTDVVAPFSGTFAFDDESKGAREAANINFNLNFDTFQLPKAGKYYVTIEADGDELAEMLINVVEAKPA